MANVKKGTLTRPPQWWKHLKDYKKVFWKAERQAHKKMVDKQIDWAYNTNTETTN